MTQNASDVEIANQGFAAFRQDLNDVLEDITTLHSGTAAPSTTYANQWWYETDTDKLYIRNEDNDAWIEILTLDQANDHLASLGASITLDSAGAVTLQYNGSGKLATTSTGVDVTGTVTADGLTVDGNADISSSNTLLYFTESDTTDVNTALQGNAGLFRIQTVNDAKNTFTQRFRIDHATGDISFFEDTGTTAKLFWDASAESLGIGTDSPVHELTVKNATQTPTIRIHSNTTSFPSPRLEFVRGTDDTFGGDNYSDHRIISDSGHLIFQESRSGTTTEIMRLLNNASVSIGSTSNDGAKFLVAGDTSSLSTPVCYLKDNDGSVEGGSTLLRMAFTSDTSFSTAYFAHFGDSTATQGYIGSTGGGSVTYTTTSDERLKQNIVDTSSKWDAVKAIQVRDFEWKSNGAAETGFIAQELNNHCPNAVTVGTDDVEEQPWGVDYGKLTPLLTKALQEAITKIEDLEARIEALEGN